MPDLAIDYLPLAGLTPYARNARTHSPAQVAQLVASIREFGWTNPVLVDEAGGIIAGHGRVMAAQQLGIDPVPCIRLAHLTDVQRRAYVLADNQLAINAGWDEALLAQELAALDDSGYELSLTGISADDLEAYLADMVVIGAGRINDSTKRQTNNLGIVGKGSNVGLTFGDLMVTIPREVYEAVSAAVTAHGGDARDALVSILMRGINTHA